MGFVSQGEYAVIAQQVLGTFRIHLGQVLLWARDRIRLILRDIGTIVSGSIQSRYRLLSLRSIVFPVMTEDYLLIPDFLTVLLVLVARGAGFVSPTAVILSTWIVLLQYLGFNALLELTGNLLTLFSVSTVFVAASSFGMLGSYSNGRDDLCFSDP